MRERGFNKVHSGKRAKSFVYIRKSHSCQIVRNNHRICLQSGRGEFGRVSQNDYSAFMTAAD